MVSGPLVKKSFSRYALAVGYASEYLTRCAFAAIPMSRFPLMFIYCILYHFWDVRRILLPPLRQFSHTVANQLSSSHSQLNSSIVQDSAFHSPTIIPQSSSPVLSRPHFSHLAAPTLIQPSPGPCLISNPVNHVNPVEKNIYVLHGLYQRNDFFDRHAEFGAGFLGALA